MFFDAIGTTSSAGIDTWSEAGYSFNFGDSGSGNWATTGASKNVSRGFPVAAHVFETPGTFTVKVKARDSSGGVNDGDTDQAEVTITVTDPDIVYSSTATISLSRNTDHTGAPSGATLLNNVSSWPTWTSNRRYLLQRGQDFTSLGTPSVRGSILAALTDGQIGACGTGAKPIVDGFAIEEGNPSSIGLNYVLRFVVMDLDSASPFSTGQGCDHIMFLRCEPDGPTGTNDSSSIDIGGDTEFYFDQGNTSIVWPTNHFIVECNVTGGHIGITGVGRNMAVLGSTIDLPGEHDIRWYMAYKAVFEANNPKTVPGSIRHQAKIQGGGTDAYSDSLSSARSPATRYVAVRKNLFTDASNDWAVALAPESGEVQQGIEDCGVEDNQFDDDWSAEVALGGRRLISRGNVNTTGTFNEGTGAHSGGIPSGWNGPYETGLPMITTEDPT